MKYFRRIDCVVILQLQKGVNVILGVGGQGSHSCSAASHWRNLTDTQRLLDRHTHTRRRRERGSDGVWQAPPRADKSGFRVMMRPTHGCIVPLRGADLPGRPAGWRRAEANHYLS